MFVIVIRYDKKTQSVSTVLMSDDYQSVKSGFLMSLEQLGQYVASNNGIVPFNFSIDRNGKVVQDVGSFDRLMPLDRNSASSTAELTCSNIVLQEIQSTKGKSLGYRVLNSDTLLISNLKTDELLALESHYNRPILQNAIVRNNKINCYPYHPFNVMTVNVDKRQKQIDTKDLKRKPIQSSPVVRHQRPKRTTGFNAVQNKELEECKKAGIDPKLISNPDLSNKQMRVLWVSKKNGARAEAFNNPDINVDAMKFYADTIYTEEDEKVCKDMLAHPELSKEELVELYDCVKDGVDYKNFIGKSNIDIFIEREKALNSKKVDNRTEKEREYDDYESAIRVAMRLKGLI